MGILFIVSIGLFFLLSIGVLLYLTYDTFCYSTVSKGILLSVFTLSWSFITIYWYIWFVSRLMEMQEGCLMISDSLSFILTIICIVSAITVWVYIFVSIMKEGDKIEIIGSGMILLIGLLNVVIIILRYLGLQASIQSRNVLPRSLYG